jgi:hypothetical protein
MNMMMMMMMMMMMNNVFFWLKIRVPHPLEKVRETLWQGGGSDFQNNSY